VNCLES